MPLERYQNKMRKRCNVDSLNLSSETTESIFFYHADYTIETVKSRSVFNPKVWSTTFGKSLTKNIIEAKIIHTYLGLTLPLKTFSVTPKSQTLEFAGLHGYNERSRLLVQHLQELESQLQYAKVTRLDVAIDFKHRIPKSIIKALSKHRKPLPHKNSIYYKTDAELEKKKRTNTYMDIKVYDKALKEKLDYPLYRLEFVFKGRYFKDVLFKDIETSYKKMEKSIKKATGLSVKIEPILTRVSY